MNLPDLPAKKTVDYAALGLKERRAVEVLVPRAQAVWKLYTTGAAGSQGLMGQPMIHRLTQRPGVAVWPFDAPGPITLAEVYPSLIAAAVARDASPDQGRGAGAAAGPIAVHPVTARPPCAAV